MKILHLIPSWGNGGAERQLALLATSMATTENECHVAYTTPGPHLATAMQCKSLTLHKLTERNNHNPGMIHDLITLIRKTNPDIIQTWMLQMDVMGGLAAMATNKPFIISERSAGNNFRNSLKFSIRRHIAKKADAIIANSRGGAEYWNLQRPSCPIFIVNNGLAKLAPVGERTSLPLNTPERLIIFAGRLVPEKNVKTLIEAAQVFLPKLDGYHLYLFGAGPLRDSLQRQIDQTGVGDRICLYGHCDNLPLWLKHSHAMVSLSHFEGQPNVVLEAAQAGCPLILSDIPAHRDVIPDDAAWFCNGNNANDVAKSVLQALSDEGDIHARSERARQAVAGRSVDATVAEYLRIYEQVLGRTR